MSVTMVVACDVCGTKKGETNHWTAAVIDEQRCLFVASRRTYTFDGADAELDLCSDACCAKVLQRWLSARKAADDAAVTL